MGIELICRGLGLGGHLKPIHNMGAQCVKVIHFMTDEKEIDFWKRCPNFTRQSSTAYFISES